MKLNDYTFEKIFEESEAIAYFYTDNCSPCKEFKRDIPDIENETGYKIFSCNVYDTSNMAMKYGILSVPTMIVFNGGKIVQTIIGYADKRWFVEKVLARQGKRGTHDRAGRVT